MVTVSIANSCLMCDTLQECESEGIYFLVTEDTKCARNTILFTEEQRT